MNIKFFKKNDIEALKKIIVPFRKAIELSKNDLGIPFTDFPMGCCGDTCLLLCHYLKSQGFNKVRYVVADDILGYSHAWLEVNNVIIDITASQFEDIKDDVIVNYKVKLPFYKRFSFNKDIYHTDFENYDNRTRLSMEYKYNLVMKNLSLFIN